MSRASLNHCFLIVMIAAASWVTTDADAITFNRIVVFGSSISDSGNAFALTGFAHRPPYEQFDPFLLPAGPYSVGGNRFTNGATWIEQFARDLGVGGSVRPAFASGNRRGTNYAVGGARASDDGMNVNLPQQVAAFLDDFDNVAPADALYVLDFGGNDVRAALMAGDPQGLLTVALSSIAAHVQLLYAAGARKFLVVNVADLGLLPSVRILENLFPGTAKAATILTEIFNAELDAIVAGLAVLPEINIARLDVFGTVREMIENPSAFGLTEVEEPCITPEVPPFSCTKPRRYLFWDGIHPTRAVHAIFAALAADVLGVDRDSRRLNTP